MAAENMAAFGVQQPPQVPCTFDLGSCFKTNVFTLYEGGAQLFELVRCDADKAAARITPKIGAFHLAHPPIE